MGGDSPTGSGSGSTRVISPAGRTNFDGSGHGNNVAGVVASTDLRLFATSDPPPAPATWPFRKGLAYGLDKLYDPYQAKSGARWEIGLPYQGEPGVSDLPEVINYSAGIYEDSVDANPAWSFVDAEVADYGITQTISGGNCGINPSIYAGCNGAPGGNTTHRVSTPGNLFNTITLGGLSTPDIYDSTTWTVWPNSSPGPTHGGRKKPDLISDPGGGVCPANWDVDSDTQLNDYDNCGSGTSYAAPRAAAGAILLASTGVYKPATQKAILINSATPIQGQTYWMPRSGWGALNLDGAFIHRGHYEDGFVTEAGENSARFFSQSSVAVGDKTTMVWNRRTASYTGTSSPLAMTLTNLDLFQFAAGDACSPSCTPTATGGVDANDSVDTDQTVTADNPMPGNGTDGPDNVEQVRSTGTGTGNQIIKVKAMSTIDSATEEPFSLAANHPITALETPIPDVTLDASPATVAPGDTVTVTATINNPSADLELSDAEVSLSLLAGAPVTGGDANPKILGTLAATGTTVATWQVTPTNGGTHNLNATADGTTYGETFSGQGADSFLVDDSAPVPTATAPGTWSPDAAPAFSWSATDDSAITGYDVELSRDGGAFVPLLTDTTSTSTTVPGAEGERLAIRVSATDEHDKTSGWVSSATTTIDAVPPAVAIGAPSFLAKNVVSAAVSASNVGSPLTSTYAFTGGPAPTGFDGSAQASFTNARVKAFTTTLTVTSTDALGRSATAVQTFAVPSLYLDPAVRIKSAKVKNGELTIRGTVVKSYRGSVSVKISRVGRVDSRRVAKRIRARNGAFRLKTALKPGRYRVRASVSGGGTILAGSITKIVRVR